MSATSKVVTPHCGAHSLSVDLTFFEISATGGQKRFARRQAWGSAISGKKDKTAAAEKILHFVQDDTVNSARYPGK